MRIHLAALGAASLLALAGGRSEGSRVQLQGIPLGDLVRTQSRSDATTPKPGIPTTANPTVAQLGGAGGGTSVGGTGSAGTGTSGSGVNPSATPTNPNASPGNTIPGSGIGNNANPAGTGV